jgi:hypothetical protein
MILEFVLVFAMIGLLGLVLRWTFKRDKDSPVWPDGATPWSAADLAGRASQPMAMPYGSPAAAAELSEPVTLDDDGGDDFGLLAEVARADSTEEVERIRAVLARAGIRATTTVGRDGRPRVLVFTADVHRARRIAGGSS